MIEDPPIPEESFINGQILITSYLDGKGRMRYAVGTNGTMNIAQVLGLLCLGGISVFRMYEDKIEPLEYPEEFENDDECEDDND